MTTILSLAFVLFLAAPAGAQQAASTGTVTAVQPPAKRVPKRKAVPAPKEDKKNLPAPVQTGKKEPAGREQSSFAPGASKGQGPAKLARSGADQAEEEGAVMIDVRSGEDYSGNFSADESAAVPGGMPASYGQLKGTLADGGRSLLVFENEEGVVSFVQIVAGKDAVSWKLISRIYRSAD